MVYIVFLLVVFSIYSSRVDSLASDVDNNLSKARLNHEKGGRGRYLFNSSWPADHGDSSRSKFSLGAGLPANFNLSDIKLMYQPELKQPQW